MIAGGDVKPVVKHDNRNAGEKYISILIVNSSTNSTGSGTTYNTYPNIRDRIGPGIKLIVYSRRNNGGTPRSIFETAN